VISAPPDRCILVEAGPGTGKTAVACARVAHILKQGIPGSHVLLISFTRTAVAELRQRIIDAFGSPEQAATVTISTLDSYAWSLHVGFPDAGVPPILAGYDANIEKVLGKFGEKDAGLIEYIQRFDHVLVDEYQDIVGIRAALLAEVIRHLRSDCGLTIFADSAQAIYGFTTDESSNLQADGSVGSAEEAYLALLTIRDFENHALQKIYRTDEQGLLRLLDESRRVVLETGVSGGARLAKIRGRIEALAPRRCNRDDYDGLRGRDDTLVLYRRRTEVLLNSSFLSTNGVEHRLRMSGMPALPKSWIGRVLAEIITTEVRRSEFSTLWRERMLPRPAEGASEDLAWLTLRRLAGSRRGEGVEMLALRNLLARARPPSELCDPDMGSRGPILGTIHASKGREAERVLLMLPSAEGGADDSNLEEESRVLYVGATRARRELAVGEGYGSPSGRLQSGRVFRIAREYVAAQVEIGRAGDFEPGAHMMEGNARLAQETLLGLSAAVEVEARAAAAYGFEHRVYARLGNKIVHVATFSEQLKHDLWEVSKSVGTRHRKHGLRPALQIKHMFLIGVCTSALSDEDDRVIDRPYQLSKVFLAPVIKGFPMVFYS